MNALRARTLTLAGLLLAGLATLTLAPAAARADGADWQDPDYQSYRHIQDQIIDGGNQPGYSPVVTRLYAAIAYSPSTGRLGSSWDYNTLEEAERRALQECDAADARIVTWAHNGQFCAFAKGTNGSWATAAASTQAEAEAQALASCRRYSSDCRIEKCLYAGD